MRDETATQLRLTRRHDDIVRGGVATRGVGGEVILPASRVDSPHTASVGVCDPEQRVIRQLVEALLFEGLVSSRRRPRCADVWPTHYASVYTHQLDFSIGGHELRCLGTLAAFDRVRIAQGSVEWVRAGQPAPVSLAALIAALEVPAAAQERLRSELEQTVTLCRWNEEHLTHHRASRRELGFQALESAIVEGHQYHPSFKARTGFSLQDHQDFGAEAGRTFQLEWLAITKSQLCMALPSDEASFWRDELGEAVYLELCEELTRQGGQRDAYGLLPVHPWQLRALRAQGLDERVSSGEVRLLGAAGDWYHASQSLRTLVNASCETRANVKLPLDIVCTSTHRNLEGHFVCTAPALSDWLVSLVAGDAFLQAGQKLLLLREYAGIVHALADGTRDGRLGVLYRESVCGKLAVGEAAVPFTALTIVESDGRPFIATWIDKHGARRWVARLLEVMLVPLWHMLVHHGIAFESHAQNLILVHRDGWPEKLALRDFHEDTELVPDYLRAPETLPRFADIDAFFAEVPDDDGYRMASTDSLRELFTDCVYVYNLADVSFLLQRFFVLSEEDFWSEARAQLQAYARSGITDQARIARVACDRPRIVVESLLKKKLEDGRKLDFFEHEIRNTLHG